jgi:hypothetical protein
VERSKKHTKVKNKREMDRDEYKASKKIRKEERHRSRRDRDPGCDLASRDVPGEAKALPGKTMTLKGSSERSGMSSSKQKNVSRHNPSEKFQKSKDEDVVVPNDENKEYFHQQDAQRSDLSSKKRIVEEWEDSQHNSEPNISKGINRSSATKETFKDQSIKEAKLKSLKSEEAVSMTDSKSGKLNAEQILSCDGGHINNELVEDNTLLTGRRGMPELENQLCDQALDMAEPASGDVACFQPAAVTSSSSKSSGSEKKKQNAQVAKTSPADSRSSSQQRKSNIEKTSHNRISGKDGFVNMVKTPNTEIGVADNVQHTGEPVSIASSRRKSDRDNGQFQLNQGNASDGIHLERGSDDDLQHESGRTKGSRISRGYNHSRGDKSNYHTDASPVQPGKHAVEPKTSALDAKGDSTRLDNKKSTPSFQDRNGSTHYPPDNTQQSLPGGKDKSQLKSNKQDLQKPKAQMACSPLRETKQESHSTPLKSNMSKLTPQLRQYAVENGGQHGIVKQATPNADTSSPARKDGTSAAFALKEARDLKHKANHLKVVLLSLSLRCDDMPA